MESATSKWWEKRTSLKTLMCYLDSLQNWNINGIDIVYMLSVFYMDLKLPSKDSEIGEITVLQTVSLWLSETSQWICSEAVSQLKYFKCTLCLEGWKGITLPSLTSLHVITTDTFMSIWGNNSWCSYKLFSLELFLKLPTDKNLPNSSSVEVEVTPPMNGTAGQEGEAVSTQTCTHNSYGRHCIVSMFLPLQNISCPTNCVRLWKGNNIKVKDLFINILRLSPVSVSHLECDWCKGCSNYGTGHYCW